MLPSPLRILVLLAALVLVSGRARAQDDAADAGESAQELVARAQAAARARLDDACVENARAALALDDRADTRVLLVGCEEHAGKILDALREMQIVLDGAIAAKDAELGELAAKRVENLLARLGHVRVTTPEKARELKVLLDGAELGEAALAKAIAVDPGKHTVHADGTIDGQSMTFEETVDVGEGKTAAIDVALEPCAPEYLTPGQIACLQAASSQEDVLRCLPSGSKSFVARVGADFGAYQDTLAVRVLSPGAHAMVGSPTQGWNVAAS